MFDKLKKFKRSLYFCIQKNKFLADIAIDINQVLFHWDVREYDKKFGPLNPQLKFFVVRCRDIGEGLLSLYLGILGQIYWCNHNGFIPVIDFQNYRTQYNVDFPVNGTRNAWEYYFEQPYKYTLEEVYQSRNVRLSGWNFRRIFRNPPPTVEITDNIIFDMMKIAPIKQYVFDIANEKIKADGINNMIGLLVRGTDYTKLKPAGHSIVPTPEMAAEKLEEFFAKYGRSKIFLATEDENIYKFFRAKYGNMIYTTDYNLVHNYSGRDYIANEISAENKYKFGLDYLVKMICLSECRYLIASNVSGSHFARILNRGRYADEYIFNLGRY